MAQSVARRLGKAEVTGSSPANSLGGYSSHVSRDEESPVLAQGIFVIPADGGNAGL